jgi:hypothetical protein
VQCRAAQIERKLKGLGGIGGIECECFKIYGFSVIFKAPT